MGEWLSYFTYINHFTFLTVAKCHFPSLESFQGEEI